MRNETEKRKTTGDDDMTLLLHPHYHVWMVYLTSVYRLSVRPAVASNCCRDWGKPKTLHHGQRSYRLSL